MVSFLCICYFISILSETVVTGYKLTQVVILSRHNIRTPWDDDLQKITPKKWPVWSAPAGQLTPKGGKLEVNNGEYFRQYFKRENFISDECPTLDSVYVYANSTQRTIDTAKYFLEGLFKDCDVPVVEASEDTKGYIFTAAIRNSTREFQNEATKNMLEKLKSINYTDLYLQLDKILDWNQSEYCQVDKICSLTDFENGVALPIGNEPDVKGGFEHGNTVVDNFIMGYYDGMPLKKIAWGAFKTGIEQLEPFTNITREIQNLKFGIEFIAKHIAKPLLINIMSSFLSQNSKLTLLFGHDTNILSVLAAIGFEHYNRLPNTYEGVPIGSKLVLQKWHNEIADEYLFKADLVYRSMKQIRCPAKLSLDNPPETFTLKLNSCVADEKGFCPWSDFLKALQTSIL